MKRKLLISCALVLFVLFSVNSLSLGSKTIDISISPFSSRSVKFDDVTIDSKYGAAVNAGFKLNFVEDEKKEIGASAGVGFSFFTYDVASKANFISLEAVIKAEFLFKATEKIEIGFGAGGAFVYAMAGSVSQTMPEIVADLKGFYNVTDSLSVGVGVGVKFAIPKKGDALDTSNSKDLIFSPRIELRLHI